MKQTEKLVFLDILGISFMLISIILGFIWVQLMPVSLCVLAGWLCLFIAYLKSEKDK